MFEFHEEHKKAIVFEWEKQAGSMGTLKQDEKRFTSTLSEIFNQYVICIEEEANGTEEEGKEGGTTCRRAMKNGKEN